MGVSGLLACGANTGRGWLAAGGILAIVVGVIVLAGWPVNSLWIIGLLLAIDPTFYGATIVALAIALKRGDAADETALRTGRLPRAAAARA